MPEKPDFYALLGVDRNASQEEIKRAYFRAAQRLHPDKNQVAGETEIFLEVQQAFEVLSNPKRRTKYDSTLPPEDHSNDPLVCETILSRPQLVKINEPQMIYVLMNIAPRQKGGKTSAPLNVCLVIDRSTSMQGAKMDLVKSAANEILRMLQPNDIFSVVSFSDRAEVIVPASYQSDFQRLASHIQMIHPSGATEIFQGLNMAFGEVQRYADPSRVNHIVLLTDGHTYGDEKDCLMLAKKAARQGVGISGLGIGHDWNDSFLDELTQITGGSSAYIGQPKDIQPLLVNKFKTLSRIFAEDVVLEYNGPAGVDLQYAFRLQPEVGSLPLENPVRLGSVLQDTDLKILFELLIQPSALRAKSLDLLSGSLKAAVVSRPTQMQPLRVRLNLPIANSPSNDPPPPLIVQALSRLSLFRLQEKARSEAKAGNYEKASRHLQMLASQLVEQGERDLARTALLEAEQLRASNAFTDGGLKEIKYGTRALVAQEDEGIAL
jgi:Ca-activated chloride channel family protein